MGLLSWVGLGGSGEEVSSKSSDFTDEQRHVAQLTKTDKLKEVYQKQLASRFLNDLASQITKKCFEKCSAEGKMDTAEGGCTAMCCDRYLDSFELVRRTLQTRSRR
mmetsp:Transcript_26676/g.41752  ORF Transcript_26676/g.41752 Transcript_26676/m.41752 type:complete len:106 (-) Transcript_26676:1002-1319(-)